MSRSRLTIVGTGIRAGLQTCPESRAAIQVAEKVLYLVSDPVSAVWIEKLNPTAESLGKIYEPPGKNREEIYAAIIEHILSWLRKELDLCVAFYGHPGFLVGSGHAAIRQARLEGFEAEMLPGISCDDMLLAELDIDCLGRQSFEATALLLYKLKFDPRASLILYQIAVVGNLTWSPMGDISRLSVLIEYLAQTYGYDHEVVIYEASSLPGGISSIQRVPLSRVVESHITNASTLYVPPLGACMADPEMLGRLGLEFP